MEAPTFGSIILAADLLKVGGYAYLRLLVGIFLDLTTYMSPLIGLISTAGLILCNLTCLRQVDLKKAIAYSSVSHMSLVTLIVFSGSPILRVSSFGS